MKHIPHKGKHTWQKLPEDGLRETWQRIIPPGNTFLTTVSETKQCTKCGKYVHITFPISLSE